jgi:hypothetical protein
MVLRQLLCYLFSQLVAICSRSNVDYTRLNTFVNFLKSSIKGLFSVDLVDHHLLFHIRNQLLGRLVVLLYQM